MDADACCLKRGLILSFYAKILKLFQLHTTLMNPVVIVLDDDYNPVSIKRPQKGKHYGYP